MTTTTRFAAFSLILCCVPCCLTALGNRASADLFPLRCSKTVFYRPKHPCVKYKCICPKKICPNRELENYGYYPACWHPWPFPPNYTHCPIPASLVAAPCEIKDGTSAKNANEDNKIEPKKPEQLPTPNPISGPGL
jgi:hypothetical protein